MGYSLTAELFAELAIGIVFTGVRLGTRWWFDKRGFYWDDLFLTLGTVFWALMTVMLYLCTVVFGSNVGLNDKTAMMIPEEEVATYRTGSICAFIAWLSYVPSVWAFKASLLFLYNRLTAGTWQHKLNLMVAAFTVCTFLSSMLFDICNCRPISRNWRVKPYAGDECTLRPLHYIVIEVLSIVTDIGIMAVPIPLIMAARIPLSQKVILTVLLCSGVFVVICAILRAYYSVTDIDTFATALGWASRECFVSVIIVCAPGIKPLFAHFKWFRTNVSNTDYTGSYSTRSKLQGKMFNSKGGHDFNTLISSENHELSTGVKKHKRYGSSDESQEHIIAPSVTAKHDGHPDQDEGTGIRVTTDVMLEHEGAHSETGARPHF